MGKIKNIINEIINELYENELDFTKEKEFSYFDKHNPLIREFAFSDPDAMAITLMFPILTQQSSWIAVVAGFVDAVKLVKNKSKAVNWNKIKSDLDLGKTQMSGHYYDSKHPDFRTAKLILSGNLIKLPSITFIWDNRNVIFNELKARKDNSFDIFVFLYSRIRGYGVAKAGFATQLITGDFGCFDSINKDLYKSIPDDDWKFVNKTTGKIDFNELPNKYAKYVKDVTNYIHFLNKHEFESKKLWDDWCDIVAEKIKTVGTNRKTLDVTTKFGDKGNVTVGKYTNYNDPEVQEKIKELIHKEITGDEVSSQHFKLLDLALNEDFIIDEITNLLIEMVN